MWKTHREYTGAELIGKVGGKLEEEGMKATGGDHNIGVGKYPADIECISMGMGWNLISETWILLSKKPCNLNGNERMVKLPGRIPLIKTVPHKELGISTITSLNLFDVVMIFDLSSAEIGSFWKAAEFSLWIGIIPNFGFTRLQTSTRQSADA